ncbi:MAG: DNA polymerase/3'-5' exonuclease PolX [Candidatus Hydrogenedentota bacterium]
MENAQIARIFDEIADLLELKGGNAFRVRAYQNAARTVRNLSERLEELVKNGEDLSKIPNLGESTAQKIAEIVQTGTCERLKELRQEVPSELTELMKVPQLGPRKAMELHKELNIDSLADLKKACEDHRLRDLKGYGPKTEENILKGLDMLKGTEDRFLYTIAMQHVESLLEYLKEAKTMERCEVAGSYRRGKDTIGDLDVLVQAGDRNKVIEHITAYPNLDEVLSKGQERVSVRLGGGMQVDFRFVESSAFGAALLYFTGSKAHSVVLRKRAVERDWKLNEYGLHKDGNLLAGKTEESIYHRLNLSWIPPELREDRGEVQAAEQDALPKLVEMKDVRGDMHCHTNATDGSATIEEMGQAAVDRGWQYLAITDHSKAVRVAKGLDEKRLRKHAKNIRETGEKLKRIWLLAGIEVDILKSGELDLVREALADLDWVVASIHSYFKLRPAEMTKRLISAVESGVVHCLGHPTGRLIGKREPLEFDMEAVLQACREHNVCVEINAQPERLDLTDTYCKRAKELGVRVSLGTDAHKPNELDFLRLGINTARRGWLEKGDVVNTMTTKQLRSFLNKG